MGSGQSAEEKERDKEELAKVQQQYAAEHQKSAELEDITNNLKNTLQQVQTEIARNSKQVKYLGKQNHFFEELVLSDRQYLIPHDALEMIQQSQQGQIDVKQLTRTLLDEGKKQKEEIKKQLRKIKKNISAQTQNDNKDDVHSEDDASGDDS